MEVRRYAPRLIAETDVAAPDAAAARGAGFRPLADFIFGRNRAAERIGMTAPVAQAGGGERIGMTAPVAERPGPDGVWRIGFFMPARYTLETLPRPENPAIAVRTLPEQTVAVLRFGGTPDAPAVAGARGRLSAQLALSQAWEATGEGGAWFYDPPWTIPGARRNEVWVPVAPRPPVLTR
ncbi:MAG: heme-binding protein [Acetobacteraceae bacterium]|nr:heme-binding protein [Acetobacteraceae bacterium]